MKCLVLAGGLGKRLWPVSGPNTPKPFHRLASSSRTLLGETLIRAQFLGATEIIVIGNEKNVFQIREEVSNIETSTLVVLERDNLDTAVAVIAGALIAHPRDNLVVLPADHYLEDPIAFKEDIELGLSHLSKGHLIMFGANPTYPETEYGYIEKGAESAGICKVGEFKEKPDRETALKYIDSRNYLWNTGILCFQVACFLDDARRLAPRFFDTANTMLASSERSERTITLPRIVDRSFSPLSIDYALLERAHNLLVIPIRCNWSDLGTWDKVWDFSEKDDQNNFVEGNVTIDDVQGSFISVDKVPVFVSGVKRLTVVGNENGILVSDLRALGSIKEFVAENKVKDTQRETALAQNFSELDGPFGLKQHVSTIRLSSGQKKILKTEPSWDKHCIVRRGKGRLKTKLETRDLISREAFTVYNGERAEITNAYSEPLEIVEVEVFILQ